MRVSLVHTVAAVAFEYPAVRLYDIDCVYIIGILDGISTVYNVYLRGVNDCLALEPIENIQVQLLLERFYLLGALVP